MRRRFSIRDLLWLTVVAGLAIGWWLDHREQVNRFEAMNGPLSVQVYSITVADPNAVLKVLQTMLAGTQVRLMVDTKSNFMVAYATPSQHAMIRTLVDKLEGKAQSPTSSSPPNSMPNVEKHEIPGANYSQRKSATDRVEQMPIVPSG